ncbi:hypothetical protein D0868_09817, partial [Hortaea werneckii]
IRAFSPSFKPRLSIIDTNVLIFLLPYDWISVATMYDRKAGIEVYIRPFESDTAYREYKAPRSSPLYTGDENKRYIEAVNNEQFEVCVMLDRWFDFKTCDQARVVLSMDGGSFAVQCILAKPKRPAEASALIRDSLTCHAGKWECVGFCFRELKTLEDNHLTIEEEDDEVSKRGKIEVAVQLGHMKRIHGKINHVHNCALPEETPKKVAVDKGKSHGVVTIPVDFRMDQRNETNTEWAFAQGDAEQENVFTFFYASRMILELKNIIPTTITSPNERSEAQQTRNDQVTRSRDEDAAPLIVTTGSRLPKEPSEIISLDSGDEEPPPSKKIKKEPVEGVSIDGAASKKPESFTTKSSKARERARIESQLEEIRLHREENRLQREEQKLKRQMLDLEDGD